MICSSLALSTNDNGGRMLKSIESIVRIIANLMLIASLGYGLHVTMNIHEDWKQLSAKIQSAFSENRVTIALELKLPEGSKESPSTALTNALLQMVLPTKKEPKPANSTP